MATQTKLANLINPEVIGAGLNVKLTNAIKFSPFATIGRELQGSAGNTLTIPVWEYIGDAADVAEGVAIDTELLTASTASVTVKKAGKAVEITDESVLSAYGDPIGQAEKQMLQAIASKIDADCLTALGTIGTAMTYDYAATGANKIIDIDGTAMALAKFGEDIDETTYLIIAPAQLAQLRQNDAFVYVSNGEKIISGQVGMLLGCPVVVSNKIVASGSVYTNYLVRAGALGIEMKRDINVETDRDILKKTTVISADIHYAAYLRDASKAVKFKNDET